MTKSNKVISLILSVLILLNTFVLLPITKVSAVSQTREEAVNWANSQIGNYIDVDGAYGNQCVDLIMAYYQYLGVSRVSGHGYQYVTNALPSGWTRIQNTPTFVPEPGDIVVWNTSIGGGYGHVAIFISGDTNSFVSIDQNWPKGTSCQKVTHNYNSVWGVVRPNFSSSVPPSNPTISKNQVWYDLDDTIEITAYADNATTYWMSLFYKGGDKIITQEVPSGKFTFEASQYGVGDYSIYFSCCNNVDYIDTSWLDFSIVGPATYSDIWVSKGVYDIEEPNEMVCISVNTICAKNQTIGIDKEGVGRVITQNCDSTFKIPAKDLGVGRYSAYFTVYNGSGWNDTRRVEFEISYRWNIGDEFCGKIKNIATNKYLTAVDSNVEGTDENCDKNQVWFFYRLSDNSYKIKNYYDWRAMDVENYATGGAGTNVQVYNDWDSTAQRFYILRAYDAYYIKPVCCDMVVDMSFEDCNVAVWRAGANWDPQRFDILEVDTENIGEHTIVIDEAVAPSYTETGLTEGSHCSVCGQILVKQEVIDILTYQNGDVNPDDIVNMKDIVLLQQYLNNWGVQINVDAADVNNDDVINMKDIVLLQQYMNGWDVVLQ